MGERRDVNDAYVDPTCSLALVINSCQVGTSDSKLA